MKCGEARLIMVAFVSIRRNPTPNVLFSRFDTLARSGTVGLGYELFRFQVGRWTWVGERAWESVGEAKTREVPTGGDQARCLFFFRLGKPVPTQENPDSSGG